MFLLILVAVPALEVFVFIEVGLAIGWLLAVGLLLGTSLLGLWVVQVQGRSAIERVSRAVSAHQPPGRTALDGALGFLGGLLLVPPGFVTDALGALLVLGPSRALIRRWLSRRYARRVLSFAATAGRFASRERPRAHADVESTVVDDELDQLGR